MHDAPLPSPSESPDLATPRPRAPRRQQISPWRWLLPLAGLLLLAAIVVAVFFPDLLVPAPAAVTLPGSGRVALLPFVNDTGEGEFAWVELGLQEMTTETLAQTTGVETISSRRLRRVLGERGLAVAQPASRQRIRELAFALGADLVVETSVRHDADLALELTVTAVSGAATTARFAGPELMALADAMTYALAEQLSQGREPERLGRVFSFSPFLNRLYGMGLQELYAAGPQAAQPYFEICLRHEPRFLAAREKLADCLDQRGPGAPGEKDDPSGEEQHLAVLQEVQNRGDRRLQARSLAALGDLEAAAGSHQEAAELYSQALAILLALEDRNLQGEMLEKLALATEARGELERTAELRRDLLAGQREVGDRLGQAETLLQLGQDALRGGDAAAAQKLLDEAHTIARDLGDVWSEMQVTTSLGEVALRQGDPARAEELWRQALRYYEQRDDRPQRLALERNLGEVLLARGDEAAAEGLFQDVRELAIELARPADEALAALRLARILLRQGYPLQARTHLERALALDRFINERIEMQLLIAWLAYEQGNYRLAVATQQAAKRQAGERWHPSDEAFLKVYEEAQRQNQRLPLPGEPG